MAEDPKQKTDTGLSVPLWRWRLSRDGETFEPETNPARTWMRALFNFCKSVLLCAGVVFLGGLLWGYYVVSSIPGAKPHFISLVHRWIVESTGAISSNPLGFALLIVEPLATLLVAGSLLVALRGWEEMKQELAKSISITFLVTLAVQVILFGPVFIWHGVDVIYQDHQKLMRANDKMRGERDQYQQQAGRVPGLEQQTNNLKTQLGKKPITIKTVQQIPQRCWMSSLFGFPDPNMKEAVTETTVILHCNYKVEAPLRAVVEFDMDFIPADIAIQGAGMMTAVGIGKNGKLFLGQVGSPGLQPEQFLIVRVYGVTKRYPLAVRGIVQTVH